jgi:hypothetical protein
MAPLPHGFEEPGDVQDIRLVVDTNPTLAWLIEDGVALQAGIRPGESLPSIDSDLIFLPKAVSFRIGSNHRVEIGSFHSPLSG